MSLVRFVLTFALAGYVARLYLDRRRADLAYDDKLNAKPAPLLNDDRAG